MSSGNGADIGTVIVMLNQVLQTQQEHGRMLHEHGRMLHEHGRMLHEHGRLLNEHGRILNEHGRRFLTIEDELRGLRQTLTEYHSSVIGHGILISELDARLRRVEQRLDLNPAD